MQIGTNVQSRQEYGLDTKAKVICMFLGIKDPPLAWVLVWLNFHLAQTSHAFDDSVDPTK